MIFLGLIYSCSNPQNMSIIFFSWLMSYSDHATKPSTTKSGIIPIYYLIITIIF